jgi:hypothetical protein
MRKYEFHEVNTNHVKYLTSDSGHGNVKGHFVEGAFNTIMDVQTPSSL